MYSLTTRIEILTCKTILVASLLGLTVLSGCSTTPQRKATITTQDTIPKVTEAPKAPTPKYVETGTASWYGPHFNHRKTASGERFNQDALSAAHKTLPLGTQVIVKNLDTGKETRLKINDRGPYARGRILDVSKGAAIKLGMLERGTSHIELQVFGDQLPEEVAEDYSR